MLHAMLTFVLFLGSQDPRAQTEQASPAETATESRVEQAHQARVAKAQDLHTPSRNFLDRALNKIEEDRLIQRFQAGFHGFHLTVGGMPPGSGFALGTAFENHGVRASTQRSLNGYQKHELEFTDAWFFRDRFFADFKATYRDYPQMQFYGVGSASRLEDRT